MKRLSIILLIALPALLTNCKKDFYDINANPNAPTEETIPPDAILPNALNQTASRFGVEFGWTANWIGYWAPSGSFSSNTEETTYNITTNFQAGRFGGIYDNLYDYDVMEQKARITGQTFYVAIAKTMKAYNFAALVDLYGNVPYTSAFKGIANFRPAYSKGSDIYTDLFKQLDSASLILRKIDVDGSIRNNANYEAADVVGIFGNDLAKSSAFAKEKATIKWRKFTNTLKLRLAIHLSQVPGFDATPIIASITTDGAGFLNGGESVGVNPGYTSDRPNPYWASYAFDVNAAVVNRFFRANNFALNLMKGLNDERHKFFYKPVASTAFAAGTYRGVNYGIPPQTDNSEDRLSNIGGSPTATPAGADKIGLAKAVDMPQWLMTSVESKFLQAEAIQRGWLAGNAQVAYEEAVRESFLWLNMPNAVTLANTYLAQPDTRINWTAAPNKITLIAWQKYIALNGINMLEAWTDIRRLDVIPVPLSLAPGRTSTVIPVRLLYPQNEYNFNAENATAQGTISQFTSKIFWDQ
jgi:Starch-binding associating with outer membrane